MRWATTSRAEAPGAALDNAALLRPSEWLKKHRRRKLMIYAHGGLNSEGASITRIRALAPYALANGIYPLFITWRSGALETVGDLVEELFTKAGAVSAPARASGWIERLSDKTDRLLEPLLRGPGSALWGQMKLNAERAGRLGEGGAFMMVKRLEALAQEIDNLEVHLIGHSAGAILLGALLEPLRRARLHVKTLRLFAPACTTRFALERYRPALRSGQIEARHFYVHTLSDKLERDDSVGPYRKSLLYLVSRAFEDVHKTPLLGLDRSFDAETAADGAEDDLWSDDRSEDVKQWADFWDKSGGADNRIVLSRATVSTGGGSIDASHGCFDNAVDIMGDALGTIVNPRSPRAGEDPSARLLAALVIRSGARNLATADAARPCHAAAACGCGSWFRGRPFRPAALRCSNARPRRRTRSAPLRGAALRHLRRYGLNVARCARGPHVLRFSALHKSPQPHAAHRVGHSGALPRKG